MPRWILILLLCAVTAWGGDFTFAGYNLQNYAPLVIPGEIQNGKPAKSEEAARAVV